MLSGGGMHEVGPKPQWQVCASLRTSGLSESSGQQRCRMTCGSIAPLTETQNAAELLPDGVAQPNGQCAATVRVRQSLLWRVGRGAEGVLMDGRWQPSETGAVG